MKLAAIIPVVPTNTEAFEAVEHWRLQQHAAPGTEIHVLAVEHGVSVLQCRYDVALAVPGILDKVRAAEAMGCDGVMIDCYMDSGVSAAKELVDIPVVGPVEASVSIMLPICERFSVIAVAPTEIPHQRDVFRTLGVEHRLASIRSIDTGVRGIMALAPDEQEQLLFGMMRTMVEQDGAQGIVFGCTGVLNLARTLMDRSVETFGYVVPVIEPSIAALKLLEGLVALGLTPSKRSFPRPPKQPEA